MSKKSIQEMKDNPSREHWTLRQAALKTGLPCRFYERLDDSQVYFDIILELPNGKIAVVQNHTRRSQTACPNKLARERRQEIIKKLGLPYIELWHGPVDQMWATIELWLSNLSSAPVKLAPRKNPFGRAPIIKSKERIGPR